MRPTSWFKPILMLVKKNGGLNKFHIIYQVSQASLSTSPHLHHRPLQFPSSAFHRPANWPVPKDSHEKSWLVSSVLLSCSLRISTPWISNPHGTKGHQRSRMDTRNYLQFRNGVHFLVLQCATLTALMVPSSMLSWSKAFSTTFYSLAAT